MQFEKKTRMNANERKCLLMIAAAPVGSTSVERFLPASHLPRSEAETFVRLKSNLQANYQKYSRSLCMQFEKKTRMNANERKCLLMIAAAPVGSTSVERFLLASHLPRSEAETFVRLKSNLQANYQKYSRSFAFIRVFF
jgi:hypothetical protein